MTVNPNELFARREGEVFPPAYNPSLPEVQANPYPYYAQLRAHDPVHWNDHLKAWVLSRHRDVIAVLQDPRWSANYLSGLSPPYEGQNNQAGRILLFMDGPEHAELRRSIISSLSSQAARELGLFARSTAIEILESVRGCERIDLISQFASPLTLRVLIRLLGVPEEDFPKIAEAAEDFARLIDWSPDPVVLSGVTERGLALTPYLFELVKRKRRERGDDFLSAMITQAEARRIRYFDIISTGFLLLAAGHMTSTNMIGNGVLALLNDRKALDVCLSGHYSFLQIVSELLRFDGPVQATPRTAAVDLEIHGRKIKRGEILLVLLGSANRDGSVFDEPDKIDPGRRGGLSASFGGGAHLCVGALLARLTGAAALEELFRRHPELTLPKQELKWKSTITQRGVKQMQVEL